MVIVAGNWRSILAAVVGVMASAGCSGDDVLYQIAVRNHTDEGIIIYPKRAMSEGNSSIPTRKWRINPGIPGSGTDTDFIPPSELLNVPAASHEEKYAVEMPEQLRLEWQRAELSNCDENEKWPGSKRVNGREVELEDGRLYSRKSGCHWEAYGPVREFSVSRQKIRASDAYKNVQDAHVNLMGGPAVLSVYVIVEDDGVVLETEWHYTP